LSLELQDFRGKTKTQNVLDDIGKIYKENLYKLFPEYFTKHSTKSYCVVSALENKDEIKNVGMSKVDDLLTDNFGQWLGTVLFTERQQDANLIKATDGVLVDWATWRTGNGFRNFGFAQAGSSTGMLIKTGTGSATPVRSDFNLQSLTQTMLSQVGAYNSGLGKVTMPSTKVSTINETISEAGLFGVWNMLAGNGVLVKNVLLSRDLISPVVPVSIGQQINVDYEMILN